MAHHLTHEHSLHRSKAEIACSSFAFDTVLGAGASQADLYKAAVAPVVEDVLNGYNGTIMAYGCTGAAPSGHLAPNENVITILKRLCSRCKPFGIQWVNVAIGSNHSRKPVQKLSPPLSP